MSSADAARAARLRRFSPIRRPVEWTFAAVLAAMLLYAVDSTAPYFFWSDDWPLIDQSATASGLFRQYNGHLSVVILGTYRVFLELFGWSYLPFRLFSAAALVVVPLAFFAHGRTRLGAPLAAVLALALFRPTGLLFNIADFNHYLAALGGVICAWALDRRPRRDGALAAGLAFALASAGGGVAVAAGCLVHAACTRAPLRRWLVVAAPVLLWGLWYLVLGRDYELVRGRAPVADTAVFVWDLTFAAFRAIAFGVGPLAAVLLALFALHAASELRRGLDAAANLLAWTAALVVWGVGLSYNRAGIEPDAFRYQFTAVLFLLLAVVPRRAVVRRPWFPALADRRHRWVAAGVVAVLGAATGVGVRDDLPTHEPVRVGGSLLAKGDAVLLSLGPDVVPDGTALPFRFGPLDSDDVREIFDRDGVPFEATVESADRVLHELGVIGATVVGRGPDPGCSPASAPMTFDQPSARLFLSSGDERWDVEVRRVGTEWVRLAEAGAGEVVAVDLPLLSLAQPWEVRADGACRVARPG